MVAKIPTLFSEPIVECLNPTPLFYSLPDENFQSSSDYTSRTFHGPHLSRLFSVSDSESHDSWVPEVNEVGQWIEADLGQIERVQKVEVRPRITAENWVASFKLRFSLDRQSIGYIWAPNGEERIFGGPTTSIDYVTVTLNATDARYVRLYPLTYVVYMAVKWEVYACKELGKLKRIT